MSVKTEKDLTDQQRATWLKAMSAFQIRNHKYAIELLQSVLKTAPDFLAGRQLCRKAAIAVTSGKKSVLGALSSASFGTMKAQGLLKKDPIAAMDAVERILGNDPYSPQANALLRDAALAAGFHEVATFAMETIVEGNPKDTKILHELARHYIKHGEPHKAVEIYGRITAITPNDLSAIKGAKDAAAASSMQRGGWERQETTYRDLIKDKDEAVSLEQQSRVVRSEEMIDQLLAERHERMAQENPPSVDTARGIAELYEQKNDLENAVAWFDYTCALGNNADQALVRKASDLRLRQFDEAIQAREAFIAADPDSEESRLYSEELESMKAQRANLLIQDARARVERTPTDLQARFDLADILVSTGQFREAIPELQRAKQNPSVRIRAMSLLGQCFTALSMLDMAEKTLAEAASEITGTDNTKKDIIYSLGLVYDKMGQQEKSIGQMKLIYEVDYLYRDVATRVESSYTNG